MNHMIKKLMCAGGRFRISPEGEDRTNWSLDEWVQGVDEAGEWQPDLIDKLMKSKSKHVDYLLSLFESVANAGFSNIRIDDEDLDHLTVSEHGAGAVIRELFQVDDVIRLKADVVGPDGCPCHVSIYLLLENDPWEIVMDYATPSDSVQELLSEVLLQLAEEYP